MKDDVWIGVWVVCYDLSLNPTTWGCVKHYNHNTVSVEYGKDAPIWESKEWQIDYVKPCQSQAAAKAVVNKYKESIDYDPQ